MFKTIRDNRRAGIVRPGRQGRRLSRRNLPGLRPLQKTALDHGQPDLHRQPDGRKQVSGSTAAAMVLAVNEDLFPGGKEQPLERGPAADHAKRRNVRIGLDLHACGPRLPGIRTSGRPWPTATSWQFRRLSRFYLRNPRQRGGCASGCSTAAAAAAMKPHTSIRSWPTSNGGTIVIPFADFHRLYGPTGRFRSGRQSIPFFS